jgi:alpha-beta hydrolase superfamily lysophospholipase
LRIDRDGNGFYPDLPGHGETPGPDWLRDEDQVVDMLLQFINRIIPGERLTLGGFSWGGYLMRGILYHRFADIDGMLFIAPAIRHEGAATPERRVLSTDEAALQNPSYNEAGESSRNHNVSLHSLCRCKRLLA